jgi:hypothetical protein
MSLCRHSDQLVLAQVLVQPMVEVQPLVPRSVTVEVQPLVPN